ncbi:hypothetical protein ACFFMN_23500 [Planobispora siamensis]|uniref:Uncharacterized protein n=1 Tax=Planobispora siamensis TaxID=936338 RepID=A0A8J3SMJ6_9ACTN|nr:hypothetical protein [Planobispora siamensis]GIH95331.1 hypothetical protein Psi01_59610 [Planobispora siamensis]
MTADVTTAREVQLEETRRAVRVAVADMRRYTGLIRVMVGCPGDRPMTAPVMALAVRKAERHQLTADLLDRYEAACAAYNAAMTALAELDPGVDVTDLLRGDGRTPQ